MRMGEQVLCRHGHDGLSNATRWKHLVSLATLIFTSNASSQSEPDRAHTLCKHAPSLRITREEEKLLGAEVKQINSGPYFWGSSSSSSASSSSSLMCSSSPAGWSKRFTMSIRNSNKQAGYLVVQQVLVPFSSLARILGNVRPFKHLLRLYK